MEKRPFWVFSAVFLLGMFLSSWGFFAHRKINRLAVFTLPPEMITFYKKNIRYLEEASVNPDRRRYAVPAEAPRHYIDLEEYGDSALFRLPRKWADAVTQFGEDTLMARGILPWHLNFMYLQLREAFLLRDPARILRLSAEMGHYVADAHVPLHTTRNYNGQLTGQQGIHGFWESRLPELFFHDYDFFVGPARYVPDVTDVIWATLVATHARVDSVLQIERDLAQRWGDRKFSFETRGRQTQKVYAVGYAREYHRLLQGMVERQMRASVKLTADLWYTAWVDAGQPDLRALLTYNPTEEELRKREEELKAWRERTVKARAHEEEQ